MTQFLVFYWPTFVYAQDGESVPAILATTHLRRDLPSVLLAGRNAKVCRSLFEVRELIMSTVAIGYVR